MNVYGFFFKSFFSGMLFCGKSGRQLSTKQLFEICKFYNPHTDDSYFGAHTILVCEFPCMFFAISFNSPKVMLSLMIFIVLLNH